MPGGPAARAGLRTGDLLIKAAGQPISSPAQFLKLVDVSGVGVPLALEGQRDGRAFAVTVVPIDMAQVMRGSQTP
jgi:S1-C subfamily serine protease